MISAGTAAITHRVCTRASYRRPQVESRQVMSANDWTSLPPHTGSPVSLSLRSKGESALQSRQDLCDSQLSWRLYEGSQESALCEGRVCVPEMPSIVCPGKMDRILAGAVPSL